MSTAEMNHAIEIYQKPLTAVEIRAHVNLIQEVMKAVMKENTHYGVIPGCKKPSLWKPGAEVLFTTFRISVDPIVEDLSTPTEARFRVTARGISTHGTPLGSAVGEASTNEEKYQWREVVCEEEWDATPENNRRTKWKNGRSGSYCIQQVLTNIADCRNTVLKMAAKRASVALALQVTAASDIFTQDIEDLPEEMHDAAINGDAAAEEPLPATIERKAEAPKQGSTQEFRQSVAAEKPAPVQQQSPKPAAKPIQTPQQSSVRTISDPQGRRFYAIWKGAGKTQDEVRDYLRSEGVENGDSRKMPVGRYEEFCNWAEGKF